MNDVNKENPKKSHELSPVVNVTLNKRITGNLQDFLHSVGSHGKHIMIMFIMADLRNNILNRHLLQRNKIQ